MTLNESLKAARERQQQKLLESLQLKAAAPPAPAAAKVDPRLELLAGKSDAARKKGFKPVERDSDRAPSFPARGRFQPERTARR